MEMEALYKDNANQNVENGVSRMNFQSVYCFDGLAGREPAGWKVEGGFR